MKDGNDDREIDLVARFCAKDEGDEEMYLPAECSAELTENVLLIVVASM